MAINKMLHINENTTGKNPSEHLKNAINYVCNPEKTQNGKNIFTINCGSPDTAYNDMVDLKNLYGKHKTGSSHNRQAYHFIISFSPEDNVSPELCNQITKEFCEKYFENKYQVLVATHDDQPHKHSHIIFNSVSLDRGLKYHYVKGDWEKSIMPLLNSLCEKYNLSTISLGGVEKEDLNFFIKHTTTKNLTIEKTIQNKIDELINEAADFDDLLSLFKRDGFKVNIRGKETISITPPGFKRGRRLSSLGEGYSVSQIINKIQLKNNGSYEKKWKREKEKIISHGKVYGIKKVWAKKLISTIRLGNLNYSIRFKSEAAFSLFNDYMKKYCLLNDKQIDSTSKIEEELKKIRTQQKELRKYLVDLFAEKNKLLSVKETTKKMDSLKPFSDFYNKGDSFFKKEAEEFNALEKQLQNKNITYEGSKEKERFLNGEISKTKKKKKKLSSEYKTLQSILEENSEKLEREYYREQKQKVRK